MNKVINISSNGIKQAIDDLVNENEMLQDKVYKLENIIKEVREELKKYENDGEANRYAPIIECLEILDMENNDIELDMLKALNTDLDDDVEMG